MVLLARRPRERVIVVGFGAAFVASLSAAWRSGAWEPLVTAALAFAAIVVLVRGWRAAVVDAHGVTPAGDSARRVAWEDVRAVAVAPYPIRPGSPARIEVFLTTDQGVARFEVHSAQEAEAVAAVLEARLPEGVRYRGALRAAIPRAFAD